MPWSHAPNRPVAFNSPGRFELLCHHSEPAEYPEEAHETVQVCVPQEHALYTVTRQSETGRRVVQHLGARDILVLPARQAHAISWRRPAGIMSMHLSESFLMEALGASGLSLRDTFVLQDAFVSAAGCELRSLTRDGEMRPILARAIAEFVAHKVVVAASTQPNIARPQPYAPLSARKLAEVDRYVAEHLGRTITVAELAGLLRMSGRNFARRFAASRGCSPYRFVMEQRMERASELLLEGDLSVAQVATEVGVTHSHFSRAFLSHFGVPPRAYRERRGPRRRAS